MQPVVNSRLFSWWIPPAATFAVLMIGVKYVVVLWLLCTAGYPDLPVWHIAGFVFGLFTAWFALSCPGDTLSRVVLTAYRLEQMTLTKVTPPLFPLDHSPGRYQPQAHWPELKIEHVSNVLAIDFNSARARNEFH